jgi:hypothetical protein
MLNPWLAITFHAARLGFEAQNAAAFRLMGLVGTPEKPMPVARSPTTSPSGQLFRRSRQRLRQAVAERASSKSTKNDPARTRASAP